MGYGVILFRVTICNKDPLPYSVLSSSMCQEYSQEITSLNNTNEQLRAEILDLIQDKGLPRPSNVVPFW